MANKSTPIPMIREILSLKESGLSPRQIGKRLDIARNTVKSYLRQWEANGGSEEDLSKVDERILYEKTILSRQSEPARQRLETLQALLEGYSAALQKPGVTLWRLWQEYKSRHPEGYQYTQFCGYYKAWRKVLGASMHLEHHWGDKAFLDFAGKTWILSRSDGSPGQEVQVFVAILPASQLIFAQAVESQRVEHFVAMTENALHYFGGVPAALVPDNLKSAVHKSHRYEPRLNDTFADFAAHYGTSVLPARSYKPKDKALVEGAVQIVYQAIYAALRQQSFEDITSLNAAMRPLLEALNERPLTGSSQSRRQRFEQHERPALRPLPPTRYLLQAFRNLKVSKNYHLMLREDRHHYSVPYTAIGKTVRLIYSAQILEIYLDYQRIALHRRRHDQPGGFSTDPAHRPERHRQYAHLGPEHLLEKGRQIGQHLPELFALVLQRCAHPEQGAKVCLGMLALEKPFSPQRLDLAAKRALRFGVHTYAGLHAILQHGLDQLPDEEQELLLIPGAACPHENIRGNHYYQ